MSQTPEDPSTYQRPRVDEPRVQAALARLGLGCPSAVVDLGGTMSLNLHLVNQGLVLRVHPRFVSRERLTAVQGARAHVVGSGLVVAEALDVDGSPVLEVDDRLAEVERFVVHEKPPPTWESYVWMFESMGRLHQALHGYDEPLPAPVVATYGTPSALRGEAALTAAVVDDDPQARAIAADVVQLIEELDDRWIDESVLPQHVVHGDVRLGNVVRTGDGEPAIFDFGFAARRPRIHDLAYALSWIVLRPDDSGRAEDFPWDRVPQLVSAYERGRHERLLPVERRALAPYLAAVPLYLAAISCHTPDPASHLRGEEPFIRIARWILANPREITRRIA